MQVLLTGGDKFVGDLKKMEVATKAFSRQAMRGATESLGKFAETQKRGHQEMKFFGVQSAGMRRELLAVQELLGRRVSPEIIKLTSGLGALSVGAGSMVGTAGALGAAFGLVAEQLAGFSQGLVNLKMIARETGQSVTSLKQLEAVAAQSGISAEAMDKAVGTFADNFEHFKVPPWCVQRLHQPS
jgi:hypothetical protein